MRALCCGQACGALGVNAFRPSPAWHVRTNIGNNVRPRPNHLHHTHLRVSGQALLGKEELGGAVGVGRIHGREERAGGGQQLEKGAGIRLLGALHRRQERAPACKFCGPKT